jgi:hypothetical protein
MLEEIEGLKKSLETEKKTKVNYYEQIAYFRQELSITSSSVQKFELRKRIENAEKEIQNIDSQMESLQKEIRDMEERSKLTQIKPNPVLILPNILNNRIQESKKPKKPERVLEPITIIEPIIYDQIKGDYTLLHELLTNQQWKEADLETTQIFLKIAKRQKAGWLRAIDIANISCSDILMIDQLWRDASGGQFGFSVQRNIWLSVDGKPGKCERPILDDFGDKVGWRINNNWLKNYEEFNFYLDAPQGHLPSFRFSAAIDQFVTWQESFKHFLPRIETCFSGDI